MILKNYALFEIRSKELLCAENAENILLHDIVQQLQERGIECSKIKTGSFCVYTLCKVRNIEVFVVVSSVISTRESDSCTWSSIWCKNKIRIPWWERLFTRVPQVAFDSGEALQHVCKHIKEILSSDQRLDQVRWLTREEYFDATRPSFLDVELESYLRKHSKKRK